MIDWAKVGKLIAELDDNLKGTGVRLHDFGNGVKSLPIPLLEGGWSQSLMLQIVPEENSNSVD